LTGKQSPKIVRKMNVVVTKSLAISAKTPKGVDVVATGSKGMTTLKIGKNEHVLYTDELDTVLSVLTTFKQNLVSEGIVQ
jgi:hypothetical protein